MEIHPSKLAMIPADQFWSELETCGLKATDDYTADGRSRFCVRPDGARVVVSVHPEYPAYMVDKVLFETGLMDVPLYNNLG